MTAPRRQTELHAVIQGCSSWKAVQDHLRRLSKKQKGDRFEELVKAYLVLEPEYASKLKLVWLPGGAESEATPRVLESPVFCPNTQTQERE